MANPPYVMLAQRIAGLLPDDLSRVFMTTTGSDANEAAFKLARWVNHLEGRPEKHKIISLLQSFHGNTLATTAATGMAVQWSVGAPLPPGFLHVEPPFCYRCPWHVGRRNDRCCLLGIEALEALIQREGPDTVAAIVAEPVLQAAGAVVPPPEYFPAVRRLCDRYGILLIYDEVVTGFGRTGKLFGLEHFDAVPDMVTMAKGPGRRALSGGGPGLPRIALRALARCSPRRRRARLLSHAHVLRKPGRRRGRPEGHRATGAARAGAARRGRGASTYWPGWRHCATPVSSATFAGSGYSPPWSWSRTRPPEHRSTGIAASPGRSTGKQPTGACSCEPARSAT